MSNSTSNGTVTCVYGSVWEGACTCFSGFFGNDCSSSFPKLEPGLWTMQVGHFGRALVVLDVAVAVVTMALLAVTAAAAAAAVAVILRSSDQLRFNRRARNLHAILQPKILQDRRLRPALLRLGRHRRAPAPRAARQAQEEGRTLEQSRCLPSAKHVWRPCLRLAQGLLRVLVTVCK